MMNQGQEVRAINLSNLEVKKLEKALKAECVRKIESEKRSGAHQAPEFVTVGLVLGPLALLALTIIFTQPRKHQKRVIRINQVDLKTGQETKLEIEETFSEQQALNDETVKALCNAFNVDVAEVAKKIADQSE
ncbi:MAG: hypothetical protein MI864_14965 [Pseudomonadales bacterium]|nr:hypothetical protein [Pseudomonadales bacterium]